MLNKAMLQSQMVLHGDTQGTLAKAVGISQSRMNAKINGWQSAEFTQAEIAVISKRYNLSPKELNAIFFDMGQS